MVLRIGLTGGIGSGKSTVAALLAGLGASVVDTDAIARQIALPGGAAMHGIRESFGAEFIDAAGGLDRERMRTLAFSDDTARRRLEAILHPLIGVETERQAEASTAPVVVFDVPLLVESGRWRARVHKVLVVDCSEATQVSRVVARSGWTAESVQAVIDKQASRARRRACADAVVFNEGLSPAQLGDELHSLWHAWTHPATRPAQPV
ncbi:MAG: dephospho-CoA kinase [Burkholderiales bacterium]|nr:dephospho-CoA kinase [Burkholderiales bacterium]